MTEENETIAPPDGIVLRRYPGKGLGVMATRPFKAGEVIETCLAIIIDKRCEHGHAYPLQGYAFEWGEGPAGRMAVLNGWGMLYNHDDDPNAMTAYGTKCGRPVVVFVARCDIEAGEEICHNYESPDEVYLDLIRLDEHQNR